MSAKFKIVSFYPITARNLFVLTGNLTEGNLDKGMIILSEEGMRIKISSVEAIVSANNNKLIGLTFANLNEQELGYFKKQKKDNIIQVGY